MATLSLEDKLAHLLEYRAHLEASSPSYREGMREVFDANYTDGSLDDAVYMQQSAGVQNMYDRIRADIVSKVTDVDVAIRMTKDAIAMRNAMEGLASFRKP